ncbi:hypothetical protein ACH5RR_031379 [Cinchona calisaya]|uniref:Cation-transporting P-type ATPase N-terminal domain-containing protein n=1 Tax=Cinchona calisaya TaxID=153742 RepID=A0ABD2YJH5_9GENT
MSDTSRASFELPKLPTDAAQGGESTLVQMRWRSACTKLRSIRAFSQAAKNQTDHELLTPILSPSPPDHIVLDVIPECPRELAGLKDIDQLYKLGGVEGVTLLLKTSAENGIQDDDIDRRRQEYGSNRIQKPAPKTLHVLLENLWDPIIFILLVCAVLSLGFGTKLHGLRGLSDGGSIFLAVFIVIIVNTLSNIRIRRQFYRVSEASDNFSVSVIRNRQSTCILVFEVVVGDVICLKAGDQVPADGLYVEGNSLRVDESNLIAGMESVEVDESNNPFLRSGTKVGLSVASLVLVVLLIRYFTGNMHDDNGKSDFTEGKTRIHQVWKALIGILATPVAIAATSVPEGLLLAVMITIAYSTKKMASQQAQVRNLSAFEAIGSVTVICTDERGKLTLDHLKVSEFCFGTVKHTEGTCIPANVLELLFEGIVLRNNEVSPGNSIELTESQIHSAIHDWVFRDMSTSVEQVRANCTVHSPEIFNFDKTQSIIWIKKRDNNNIHVHQKGEPEELLTMCSHYYDEDGLIKGMPENAKENWEQIFQEMKSRGLRCIAFAHKDVPEEYGDETGNFNPNLKEENFTFLGYVGLKYQCRPEVDKAVKECLQAGTNVKLVTRNDLITARAIAIECGIVEQNQHMTTGEIVDMQCLQNNAKNEIFENCDKIRVMARASTLDKIRMVQGLEQIDHVVAFTGHSIGDAAVLSKASVGLSLGIQGNSDIIILDDNFDSVTRVLRWGRSMYHKIQIYAQFQLTVSISSLVIDFVTAVSASEPPNINVVAAISAGQVPYAAFQVLWVKLIVGTLAALAITIEEPADELRQLPQISKGQPVITSIMWKNIVGQALYPIVAILTIQFKGIDCGNVKGVCRYGETNLGAMDYMHWNCNSSLANCVDC